MRFLCLHGMGANSGIFEMQTAGIRHELGMEHSYEFLEASIPCPDEHISESVKSLLSSQEDKTCFAWYDPQDPDSVKAAVDELDEYVREDGPFDGVMAFSQGAALAATLIYRRDAALSQGEMVDTPFRCAIFLCGAVPFDYSLLCQKQVRRLNPAEDGQPLSLPTANVHDPNETEWPGASNTLSKLCSSRNTVVYEHSGGHTIPRGKETVSQMVRAVRNTIEKAELLQ